MTPCDLTRNMGSRISTISFDSPNGVYFENEEIIIRVVPVGTGIWDAHVSNFSHTLIALETGDLDRLATYNGGDPAHASTPYSLYNYTVQPGDFSRDLDYNASDALYWRVGTGSNFAPALGGPYNCRLPPQSSGSLAAGGDIAVIGVPRQDAYVRGDSPDRTYGVGETVTVAVEFGEDAVYSGADPGLLLNVSGSQRTAEFWTGNNSKTFLFNYTVRHGDNTGDLGYWGSGALTGSIANLTGTSLRTLPSFDTLSFLSDINFTTPPAVESVSSPNGTGVYGLGETIRVWVDFSDAVDVAGTPMLELGTDAAGGKNRSAAYAAGTGTQRLAFDYTVQAGDRAGNLGYAGGAALSGEGDITDADTGEPAGLALPEPGGAPLSADDPILVDHAAPVLVGIGAAVNGTGFDRLGSVRAVEALEVNGTRYVLAGYDGIELIRVNGDGTMESADSARSGTGGFDRLSEVTSIDAFEMGGAAYAIASSDATDDGVQLLRVNPDGTLEGVRSLGGIPDAWGVDAFRVGADGDGDGENDTYALVGAPGGATPAVRDTVRLLRVHPDGTLQPVGNATGIDAHDVSAFGTGDPALALATGYDGHSVYSLRAHSNGTLERVASLRAQGGSGGTLDLDTFALGGRTYALVSHHLTPALDLVRVNGDGTLERADWVPDRTPGFASLSSVRGISTFESRGGGAYALVGAEGSSSSPARPASIQVVRVVGGSGSGSGGADILPVGRASAAPGDPGFESSGGPYDADVFELGGRTYAAVAASGDDAVQLVRLSPAYVESVSSPNATGAHAAGARILVNVTFSDPVEYSGDPPLLLLDAGGIPRNATYLSGSGTSSLIFNYTVLPGDSDAALGYPAVYSLSGDIRYLGGRPADPTLPRPGERGSLSGHAAVVLDNARPTVQSVSSPNASRTYGIGSNITVSVTFDEAVEVAGMPTVEIRLNGTETRAAEYSSGGGTPSLLFTYTVRQGDVSEGLARAGSPLALGSDGLIRDLAGNDAVLALPLPGQPVPLRADGDAIRVDGTRPAVESVSSPDATGPYGIGSTISIDVNFTMPVWVAGDGRPFVVLATGGTTNGSAAYASGSGEKSLRFEYVVREGDDAPRLDYANSSALFLNGSTIRDAAGNDARPGLPDPAGSLLAGGDFMAADGVRPEAESVSTPNRTGTTYYTNQRLHISVGFSEDVTVRGEPALPIALDAGGPPPARALYVSGNGTDTLVFAYDVRPGDSAAALDYARASDIDLGGGTIRDAAGNDARPGLPAPGPQGSPLAAARIAVDGTVVSVASVTSPLADGAYAAGSRINVTVTFTEAVSVEGGPPLLGLDMDGGEGRDAAYASGTGSASLAFAYEVQPGDNAGRLAYAGGSALRLNGGSIVAVDGGAPAHLDLPVPGRDASLSGSKAIAIDTAPPSVERVYSPNRTGTYGTGDTVHIVVAFGEDVEVSGTPLLGLETGDTDSDAAYASGSGTASLLFLYTVAAGDLSADLDYSNASALRLAGGSVADLAGNAANLALPAPGPAGSSLAGTSGIAVRGGTAGPGGNGGGPGPGGNGGGPGGNGGGPGPGGNGGGPGPGPGGTSMCAATLSPPAIQFDRVEVGGQSDAVAQTVVRAGTLPIAEVSVNATAWTDGSGRTVLPAGATSVLPAGASGIWKPLGGAAVDVPVEGGTASVQLRLDVPPGALQGVTSAVDASQVVTYTVSCEP